MQAQEAKNVARNASYIAMRELINNRNLPENTTQERELKRKLVVEASKRVEKLGYDLLEATKIMNLFIADSKPSETTQK